MNSDTEQEKLVVDATNCPKVTLLGRVMEMQNLANNAKPSVRVIEESEKTLIVISPKPSESKKSHSWDEGLEDDDGWNEHLLKYKRKWACATATAAAPGLLMFCVPFFVKVFDGRWMVPSGGWTKESFVEYNSRTIPAVLSNHFYLACVMLVLLFVQIGLAICVVKKSSVPGDMQHKLHRWCGRLTAPIILMSCACGTLALAFCDIGPKRGIESAFFVWIGILMIIYCYKAVMFAGQKKYGLHMQYMFLTLCLVTSPGWNRITLNLQKIILIGPKAFYDSRTLECMMIPNPAGFYYTWSFLLAQIWIYSVWFCAGVPFVKRYSTGFWLNGSAALLCGVCVWEMAHNSTHYGLRSSEACTQAALDQAALITTAINNHGRHSLAFAYGLCAPNNVAYGMKIPSLYGNPNTTYIEGMYPGY